MKRILVLLLLSLLIMGAEAQSIGGKCGNLVRWEFDGFTLTLSCTSKIGEKGTMSDFDLANNIAPWSKKDFNIRKLYVGVNVVNIGSCAFANCNSLKEVVFEGTSLSEIGWGAFMNCSGLRTISLPAQLDNIGTLAFANCSLLPSVTIPAKCRVGDMAFVSCDNVQSVYIAPTAILGSNVFVSETKNGDKVIHSYYDREVRSVPAYINTDNCQEYGFAREAIDKYIKKSRASEGNGVSNYDIETSEVDNNIPLATYIRDDSYVLVIGNQNYRFAADVPYAIHDARVFAEYCRQTLGIPAENVHLVEDATKAMIMEEEFGDWLPSITSRKNKNLIVYYAGHGVPDINDNNKSYILPTDIRGTNPKRGIALDEFYSKLGDFGFAGVTVLLDACFSGVNRNNQGVVRGTRGVGIMAHDTPLDNGNIVVFAAAQGNEMAHGYDKEGHGLFTYCLLKELQRSGGIISLGELSDNIKGQVSKTAAEMGARKAQNPTTRTSSALEKTWRTHSF